MRAQTSFVYERYTVNPMFLMRGYNEAGFVAVTGQHGMGLRFVAHTAGVCYSVRDDAVRSVSGRVGEWHIFPVIPDSAVFQQLIGQWHRERGATSSITRIVSCRSYQRIIGMGREAAVPLILRDLESNLEDPDHWFWALQALTGEDPVPDHARGDMREMARAWLDWGRQNGHAIQRLPAA